MRLCLPEELDALVPLEPARRLLDVDSPESFIRGALLLCVYTDGRFEVLTPDDRTVTLHLAQCKVFTA